MPTPNRCQIFGSTTCSVVSISTGLRCIRRWRLGSHVWLRVRPQQWHQSRLSARWWHTNAPRQCWRRPYRPESGLWAMVGNAETAQSHFVITRSTQPIQLVPRHKRAPNFILGLHSRWRGWECHRTSRQCQCRPNQYHGVMPFFLSALLTISTLLVVALL